MRYAPIPARDSLGRVAVADTMDVRFWRLVEKRGPNECWPWLGCVTKEKHGQLRGRFFYSPMGRMIPAPRVAMILAGRLAPMASTLILACHHCDNPQCVNPAHLFAGTNSDNLQHASARGRLSGQKKTHCRNGHPLSGENLRTTITGGRYCHICHVANQRASQQRRRAAEQAAKA